LANLGFEMVLSKEISEHQINQKLATYSYFHRIIFTST